MENGKKFYTEAPIDRLRKPEVPSQLKGLTTSMMTAMEGKAMLVNLDRMQPPSKEDLGEIGQAMQKIVLEECNGLIDPDTNLPYKDTLDTWQRVVFVAPRVYGAICDIRGINEETVLNAARFSIASSIDETVMERALFNVGIGGNSDTRGSQRLPAYALSIVNTIRNIGNIYDSWAIIRNREERLKRGLDTKERREIEEAVKDPRSHIYTEILTMDDDFKKRNGIPSRLPTAEIFSGAAAAAALNGIMDPVKVRELNEANLALLRKFGEKVDVPFVVRNTLEWPEAGMPADQSMDTLGRAKITVLERDLANHDSEKFAQVLEDRGEKRGGEQGKTQSLTYAASHTEAFGDGVNLPPTNLFDIPRPIPSIVISDGSDRERAFNAGRLFNIQTASPDNLLRQIKSNLGRTSFEARTAERDGDAEALEKTRKKIASLEADLAKTQAWIDLPDKQKAEQMPTYGTVMRTMDKCENPPYYYMEPVTIPLATAVEEIPEAAEIITTKKVYSKTTESQVQVIPTQSQGEVKDNGIQKTEQKGSGKVKKVKPQVLKRREQGALFTYYANGEEKNMYVVTTDLGGEQLPTKYYEGEIAETTVELDLPLTPGGLDSYAIARHIISLEDAIGRAEIALQLSRDGDREAIHLHVLQMKEVQRDYQALYKEIHHNWYTDSD